LALPLDKHLSVGGVESIYWSPFEKLLTGVGRLVHIFYLLGRTVNVLTQVFRLAVSVLRGSQVFEVRRRTLPHDFRQASHSLLTKLNVLADYQDNGMVPTDHKAHPVPVLRIDAVYVSPSHRRDKIRDS
jgi:hypothetical protein